MTDIARLVSELRSIDGRIAALYAAAKADGRTELNADEKRQAKPLLDAFSEKEEELFRAGEEPPELFTNKPKGRRSEPMDIGSGGGGMTALPSRPKNGSHPAAFANVFPKERLSTNGWASERDFFRAIAHGAADPKLFQNAATGQQESVGADGGFAVPVQFLGRLLDQSLESEIVRPRSRVIAAMTNIVDAWLWDSLDHSSSSISGFTGAWLGEGATASREKAVLRPVSMRLNKLGIFTATTSEILEDARMFESEFVRQLIAAIGWHLDDALLNGDGVGKPLGVLNSPSVISVAAQSGQTASTITYNNLKTIFARVHPECRPNAVWVITNDALPFLLELFATDGTTSTHVPVLQPGSSTDFEIFGRPCIFTEKVPTLGSVGDVNLIDFSKYVVAMKPSVRTERNFGPQWLSDQVDFRTVMRVAGQSSWSKAFTPKAGSTLSWCVNVAARS